METQETPDTPTADTPPAARSRTRPTTKGKGKPKAKAKAKAPATRRQGQFSYLKAYAETYNRHLARAAAVLVRRDEELANQSGRGRSPEELAAVTGLTPEEVGRIVRRVTKARSKDEGKSDEAAA